MTVFYTIESTVNTWYWNHVELIRNKIDEFYLILKKVMQEHNNRDERAITAMDDFVMNLRDKIYESYRAGVVVDTDTMKTQFVSPIFNHIPDNYRSTNPDKDFTLLLERWWDELDDLLTNMNHDLLRTIHGDRDRNRDREDRQTDRVFPMQHLYI